MNNDLQWEKVLEWIQNETTYLIHIVTDQQQISIEVEDKYTGDIWESTFSSTGIEELTAKAKNPKKYIVFTKMLISALLKTSDSLSAQILSYRQLNNRFGKGNSQSKAISPQQISKRFLILTYVGQFQKMQFPLPLMYFSDVTTERLKLTIKRMAQQMHVLKEGQSEDDITQENALLKYQNESLRSKLKTNSKLDNSSFLQPKLQELQKEVAEKNNQIQVLEEKVNENQKVRKEMERKLRQSEERVQQLQEIINDHENDQKQKIKSKKHMVYYQQNIQQMITQMKQLSQELQDARQKQKKNELKISTLQKQLQKMIANKRSNQRYSRQSSPEDKQPEKELSVKSGRSNTSQKSLNKNKNINRKTYNAFGQATSLNNSNSKKKSNKKSSIYDSDTQSSRMRKMANGNSSPYRQTVYNNNKKSQKPSQQRSRSKSKQRMTFPKVEVAVQSQIMTEDYQSGSSDEGEFDRIEGYLKDLKDRKVAKKTEPRTSNTGSKIQKRLQTLQQMIRKTALSTKTKG